MDGIIDIHSHILPGLDDGSRSLEQTLSMIGIAYSEGIRTIIATPHYQESKVSNPIARIEESIGIVNEAIAMSYPDMKLYMGSEIYYSQDIGALLNDKLIPTLAGSKYILVEFSPMSDYRYIKEGLHSLVLEGYIPILAHCERYIEATRDISRVEELISMGVYIQVNSMSIDGSTGRDYEKFTKKLLKRKLVHFIATDSHSDRTRAPSVGKTIAYINKKYGEAYTKQLLTDNPGRIITGQYIYTI